jgi:hypothetical protein
MYTALDMHENTCDYILMGTPLPLADYLVHITDIELNECTKRSQHLIRKQRSQAGSQR